MPKFPIFYGINVKVLDINPKYESQNLNFSCDECQSYILESKFLIFYDTNAKTFDFSMGYIPNLSMFYGKNSQFS